MVIKHLENGQWVEVRQNKLAEAFDHAAAHGASFSSNLYKLATNSQGHVVSAVAITKEDLTDYGLLDASSVAAIYDASETYLEGEFCIYEGKLYKALENCGNEAFDSTKWELANILIAAGSGGTVAAGEADWNAEEGEPGYIKNKPAEVPSAANVTDGETIIAENGEWVAGRKNQIIRLYHKATSQGVTGDSYLYKNPSLQTEDRITWVELTELCANNTVVFKWKITAYYEEIAGSHSVYTFEPECFTTTISDGSDTIYTNYCAPDSNQVYVSFIGKVAVTRETSTGLAKVVTLGYLPNKVSYKKEIEFGEFNPALYPRVHISGDNHVCYSNISYYILNGYDVSIVKDFNYESEDPEDYDNGSYIFKPLSVNSSAGRGELFIGATIVTKRMNQDDEYIYKAEQVVYKLSEFETTDPETGEPVIYDTCEKISFDNWTVDGYTGGDYDSLIPQENSGDNGGGGGLSDGDLIEQPLD